MSQLFELLPWDSEFFDLSIGRILETKLDEKSINTLLTEAKTEGVRCLYFEADPNDAKTVAQAEKNGFHLVDVRVILEHSFGLSKIMASCDPMFSQVIIDSPNYEDLACMREIASYISEVSRFTFDKNFRLGEGRRLYELWAEKAYKGFADTVFVARRYKGGPSVGLIACNWHDRLASITLAGVHPEHQRCRIGTTLVQTTLDWARSKEAESMRVVTQARNIQAQRLYQKMGFFTKSMSLYYHKWL